MNVFSRLNAVTGVKCWTSLYHWICKMIDMCGFVSYWTINWAYKHKLHWIGHCGLQRVQNILLKQCPLHAAKYYCNTISLATVFLLQEIIALVLCTPLLLQVVYLFLTVIVDNNSNEINVFVPIIFNTEWCKQVVTDSFQFWNIIIG